MREPLEHRSSHRAGLVDGGTVEVTAAKIIGMRPPRWWCCVARIVTGDTVRRRRLRCKTTRSSYVRFRYGGVGGGVLLGTHVPPVSRFTCDTSWRKSARLLFVANTLSRTRVRSRVLRHALYAPAALNLCSKFTTKCPGKRLRPDTRTRTKYCFGQTLRHSL